METKTIEELGVILENVPNVFNVIINRDEFEIPNNKKIFQFAINEEVLDDSDDILVYLADFDDETQTVKPLLASAFDSDGVFRKDLFEVYPPIYRKKKNSLFIIQ